MTDTLIEDDLIDGNRLTNSAITTGSRRPMFLETEIRTDTITKRRVGSTTGSRSVHDILENTKSPTDGLPPTTYTYAHSVSYMPVTQNGSYDVPVMARRDLHGDYRAYGSTSYLSNTSAFASPKRFMSNVRSQLANGYSAICDRLTHHSSQQQAPLLNSPSTNGAARYTQSSSTNYNLRRRAPVHSTPRDADADQSDKTSSKQYKDTKLTDTLNNDEGEKGGHEDSVLVRLFKRILRAPFDLLGGIWRLFFGLPWWLLLPLLLFIGFAAFPKLICRPFEHYPDSPFYKECQQLQQKTHNLTANSYEYLRTHTFERVRRNFKQVSQSARDMKDSILNSLDDVYFNLKKSLRRSVGDVKHRVANVVGSTKENAKEYCDAGLHKMNNLVEEVKREREKYLGTGHSLKPDQERELHSLVRHLMAEYAADETGQADYALEANGAKIVDTRCTEYTDEPRQNVVKFLGIPIVHMSKQPDIMIKAGRMPGQCFPFKGDQGSVVIKLAVPVKPSEFVVEHLSKNIAIVGHINSAPNNFTVYALKDKHDKEGRVLGRYFYDADNGPSLQRFKPQLVNVPLVEYIEVRVTSNWGNPNYTCLYRFRVHGDLQTVQPSAPPAA